MFNPSNFWGSLHFEWWLSLMHARLILKCDEAVVGVVCYRVDYHRNDHHDVLASFLHGEERDCIVG